VKSLFEVGFIKDFNGKPYFSKKPNLHISISHSNGFVLVGLSNIPFGIDIEKIDYVNFKDLKIAFTSYDWSLISHDIKLIYQYFSLKESYSKMIGTGFTKEPSQIEIDLIKNNSFVKFINNNEDTYVITLIFYNFTGFSNLNFNFNTLLLE
jgi:4'-phosphopantetheinyl transferase